jgi:hypothetical protein
MNSSQSYKDPVDQFFDREIYQNVLSDHQSDPADVFRKEYGSSSPPPISNIKKYLVVYNLKRMNHEMDK